MSGPKKSLPPSTVSDLEQIATPAAVDGSSAAADQAERLLKEANANLNEALTSTAPAYFAVLGLDAISQAAGLHANLIDAAPDASAQIAEISHAVAARVSAAVGDAIAENEIYFGMGAAKGLVTLRDDLLRADRALYVAVLSVDLRSFLYRSEIQRRGDPIMKGKRAEMADIARRAEAWAYSWPALDTPRSRQH
jgi:hypothetical protein